MEQAKRRGSFEERKAQAQARDQERLQRERPTCRVCGGRLKRGKVLVPGIYGSEDFGGDFGQPGTTMSEGPATKGPVDCLKCEKCGHSFLPPNAPAMASADESPTNIEK